MTAQLVRDYLVSVGQAVSGTSSGAAWVALVNGLSDAIDAPQLAIIDTAGLPPQDSHSRPTPLQAGVQILIRGRPGDYSQTAAKAGSVWGALHQAKFPGVLQVRGVNNPIWLGYTSDERRPRWSLNFIVTTE